MRLNLGCGNEILADAVNHDRVKHRPEIDVVWDLNVLPWPWADNSFQMIVASAVLEHLNLDLVQSMNEAWRILQPKGMIYLKLPFWNCDIGWWDPTHRWRFSLNSFDMFDPDTKYGQMYAFYTPYKWKIYNPAQLNKAGSSIHVTLQVRK